MTDESDIFNECTADEIVALVFHEAGEVGLQEFLDQLIANEDVSREDLEDIASGLEKAGLPGVSAVLKAAAQAPSQLEMDIADALADPFPGNRRAYLRRIYQKSDGNPLVLKAMALQGAPPDDIAFVEAGIQRRRKGHFHA